jgi:SP family facilitated glucose transporter-like MFS transporter 8
VSPALEVYQAEDSPLPSGPLNLDELAIITAISCVGGIITSICSGWIADKIGRKLTLIIFNFTYVFGWIFVLIAKNGNYLIAAKILHGLGGGVGYIVVPIFVTEISEDR